MPSRHLFIIRIALLSGVAVFAGLVVYQRSAGMATLGAGDGSVLGTLRYALWALAGTAAAAALFLRSRIESATPAQRGMMTVVGWALAEGVALFGIMHHYLGGPISTLALGILTFVLVLVLLPVPRDRS